MTRKNGMPRSLLAHVIVEFLREHLGTHDIGDLGDMLADHLFDRNFFDVLPGEFYPTPHFRAHENHSRIYMARMQQILRSIDDRVCDAIDGFYRQSPYYDESTPLQLNKFRTLENDAPRPVSKRRPPVEPESDDDDDDDDSGVLPFAAQPRPTGASPYSDGKGKRAKTKNKHNQMDMFK